LDSTNTLIQQQIFDLRTVEGQSDFDRDSMLTASTPSNVKGYDMGVAGDAVPYSIGNDDVVSIVMLVCLVVVIISVNSAGNFIIRQFRNFFYAPHDNKVMTETSSELRFQIIMALIDILLLGIVSYIYATDTIVRPLGMIDNYGLMGIMVGMFLGFFMLRWLVWSIVNVTFFGGKKNRHWNRLQLFLTAMEGVLMFPLVMLLVYFDFSIEKGLICFLVILILNKILTFYKCWSIFFKQNGGVLQTFLYFCALEMTPLLAFCGAWVALTNYLKVNF